MQIRVFGVTAGDADARTHDELPTPLHVAMFIKLAHSVTLFGAALPLSRVHVESILIHCLASAFCC
jgi:hypothetical protein